MAGWRVFGVPLIAWLGRRQCIIEWDGKEDEFSTVEVHDLASNGTFVCCIFIFIFGRSWAEHLVDQW